MNGLRRIMARIYDGSVTIGGRAARWPWEAPDWPARARRGLWQAFCGFSLYQVAEHAPGLMWLVVGVWVVSAYRTGPGQTTPLDPAPDEQDAGEDDGLADEEQPEPPRRLTPDQIRAYLVPLIRALIADNKAVHLDQVQAALTERGVGDPAQRLTALRADLESYGIPIRDGVAVTRPDGSRANRVGIHRDDLADLYPLQPLAPPPGEPGGL